MYLPEIEQNAFLTNTATQLLRPDPFPWNDHCFFRDQNGVWHVLYQHHHAVGSTSILTPMQMVGAFPRLKADPRKGDLWAPCSLTREDTLYIFVADTVINIQDGWRDFIAYVRQGRPFRMWVASASLAEVAQLELQAVLFEDDGGARDPFVFWHQALKQWVMLYAKRVVPTRGATGESGIAYRVSPDLVHWSDLQGYVIREFYYEDEMRDQVTEAIGTAESPQLVEYEGLYYLLVTDIGFKQYHRTKVWVSSDPLHFGPANQPHTILYAHAPEVIKEHDQWFISNCGMHHKAFGEEG